MICLTSRLIPAISMLWLQIDTLVVIAFSAIWDGFVKRKLSETLHKNEIHGVRATIAGDSKLLNSQTGNKALDFIKPIRWGESVERRRISGERNPLDGKRSYNRIVALNAFVHSRGPCRSRQCQGRSYSFRDWRRRNLDINTGFKNAYCRHPLRHLRESHSLLRSSRDANRRQGQLHSL